MPFDPDNYLAQGTNNSSGGFDPDAYLNNKQTTPPTNSDDDPILQSGAEAAATQQKLPLWKRLLNYGKSAINSATDPNQLESNIGTAARGAADMATTIGTGGQLGPKPFSQAQANVESLGDPQAQQANMQHYNNVDKDHPIARTVGQAAIAAPAAEAIVGPIAAGATGVTGISPVLSRIGAAGVSQGAQSAAIQKSDTGTIDPKETIGAAALGTGLGAVGEALTYGKNTFNPTAAANKAGQNAVEAAKPISTRARDITQELSNAGGINAEDETAFNSATTRTNKAQQDYQNQADATNTQNEAVDTANDLRRQELKAKYDRNVAAPLNTRQAALDKAKQDLTEKARSVNESLPQDAQAVAQNVDQARPAAKAAINSAYKDFENLNNDSGMVVPKGSPNLAVDVQQALEQASNDNIYGNAQTGLNRIANSPTVPTRGVPGKDYLKPPTDDEAEGLFEENATGTRTPVRGQSQPEFTDVTEGQSIASALDHRKQLDMLIGQTQDPSVLGPLKVLRKQINDKIYDQGYFANNPQLTQKLQEANAAYRANVVALQQTKPITRVLGQDIDTVPTKVINQANPKNPVLVQKMQDNINKLNELGGTENDPQAFANIAAKKQLQDQVKSKLAAMPQAANRLPSDVDTALTDTAANLPPRQPYAPQPTPPKVSPEDQAALDSYAQTADKVNDLKTEVNSKTALPNNNPLMQAAKKIPYVGKYISNTKTVTDPSQYLRQQASSLATRQSVGDTLNNTFGKGVGDAALKFMDAAGNIPDESIQRLARLYSISPIALHAAINNKTNPQ